jgi:hypothetical protein
MIKKEMFTGNLRLWGSLHKRLLKLKLRYEYPSISWMLSDILDEFDFSTIEGRMEK